MITAPHLPAANGKQLRQLGALVWFRNHLDLVLAGVGVLYLVATHPLGGTALGVSEGIPLALQAVGGVLVFPCNRVINLSQGGVGGAARFFFFYLLHYRR